MKDIIATIKSREKVHDRARRFGLDRRNTGSGHFYGMCPTGHDSESEACCHFEDDLYFCHHCHEGGDLLKMIQVKEKIPFLDVVKNLARDHGLRFDLPANKAPDRPNLNDVATFSVLTEATNYFYAQGKDHHGATEAFRHYGFSAETINKHKLGYATGVGLLSHLLSKGFTQGECFSSGLFHVFENGSSAEFFVKRLTFPYLSHGKTAYMAGRETPDTPDFYWEKDRKYKKLQTKKDKKPYISELVKNRVIFNQDAAQQGDYVIITEGIVDCISLDQLGFHAISPATTRFAKADYEVIRTLLHKKQTIYICNDNELSEAGDKGADAMARFLTLEGYLVKLMQIPLTERQNNARLDHRRIEERIEALEKGIQA